MPIVPKMGGKNELKLLRLSIFSGIGGQKMLSGRRAGNSSVPAD
jgi:hypothetical protein